MKKFFKHLRIHIFRGFLAIIPLGLSYLVIRFLYLAIDTRVTGLIDRFLGFKIPGLGFLLVLVFLYLLGLMASNWLGRRAFAMIEQVTTRIPLIKTIYTLGKKLADAISLPEKQAFKRAVMIEHFRPGLWSIGFVTGTLVSEEDRAEKLLKVFIPTAPNPTSGFMVVVKESQVRSLDWTVPEAMNTIISGGIVGPEKI
ncbi:MAG: DUF502 domain-containing protein [Clostridiales bacterium]|jgi:uncharacterized membrane protein|nr:DUF502 domain-containing protein [Clostridiales bacterium]